MSTRRRRREAYSTAPPAGGTTYTNAIRMDANLDRALVSPHAAYNNLAQFTAGMLYRDDGATNNTNRNIFGRTNSSSTAWVFSITDVSKVSCGCYGSSTPVVKIATRPPIDNSWNWVFYAWDRSNALLAHATGPINGTIADKFRDYSTAALGTPSADDTINMFIGSNGNAGATINIETRFFFIANTYLSLANMQLIADDPLAHTGLMIDYWKPDVTSTTQTNSGLSVLPPLIYTGASLV